MSNDRDRSIEVLLRQRRQDDADLRASEECVDAEVLAAWVDGSLSGHALADAEKHAAGCARCQTLLASMARTTPAINTRPWWRTVTAKWLVPVAAVATGLVVWVSVGQRPQEQEVRPTVPPAAPVETPRAAEPVLPPPQTAQQMRDDRSKAAANELKKERSADKTADQVRPIDAVGQAAGGLAVDALAPRAARRENDSAARPAPSPGPPVPAATPPPPATAPVASAPPLRAPAAPPALAETVTVTSEAASKQVAAGRGGGGGGRLAFMSGPEIRSPQSEYRWRIVPPSSIQRSVDGGVTWAVVDPVPVQAVAGGGSSPMVLTTGSSPSRDVCWIVGRAGVVLVTADGATWQRRTLPEAVDLVAVRASDARTATVTTADGRQFATTDGGITWTPPREKPDLGQE